VNAADPAREVFSLTDEIVGELMKATVSF
jgi:hypothetical protein